MDVALRYCQLRDEVQCLRSQLAEEGLQHALPPPVRAMVASYR
jgi:hypothetical protein